MIFFYLKHLHALCVMKIRSCWQTLHSCKSFVSTLPVKGLAPRICNIFSRFCKLSLSFSDSKPSLASYWVSMSFKNLPTASQWSIPFEFVISRIVWSNLLISKQTFILLTGSTAMGFAIGWGYERLRNRWIWKFIKH